MDAIRAWIRSHVPGSQRAYESLVRRRHLLASRSVIARLERAPLPVRLNLGAGPERGQGGWTTVDSLPGCDLYWDLRAGLPFTTGRVDAIYSSHLLEHLTYEEGNRLLEECVRVLRPGGTFSIVVPDARIYIEGYLGMRDVPAAFFGWEPAFHRTTAIDAVNYIAYMAGEHRYMFDEENLLHRLRAAGLVEVRTREFDGSLDRPERDYESIYAIGMKPIPS